MKRRVNWKVVAALAVALLVVGGGGYGYYRWQGERTAERFLAQAQRQEAEGRLEEAADTLGFYLAYRPRDNEQRLRMGELLERVGTPESRSRAVTVYTRVLRAEPQRKELRRKVVDLAIELGRYADARPHLSTLLESSPNDAGLEHLLGRCAEATGDWPEAAKWYGKAREHDPAHVESHARLAGLFRNHLDEPKRATDVLDEMVSANPGLAQAYLTRARYRQLTDDVEGWAQDVAEVRRLAPEDVEGLLAESEVLMHRGDLAGARARLETCIDKQPQTAAAYVNLERLDVEQGRPREGVVWLRKGLERLPDNAVLRTRLAILLATTGPAAEARAALEDASKTTLLPNDLRELLEARLLLLENRPAQAVPRLEALRAQVKQPGSGAAPERASQVALTLAEAHERLGDTDQQSAAYRDAVERQTDSAVVRMEAAAGLMRLGRLNEALRECKLALGLPRAPAQARILLARILLLLALRQPPGQADWSEVNRAIEAAATVRPDAVEVAVLRAEALAGQGRLTDARTELERARTRHPEDRELLLALAALAERQGEVEKSDTILAQAKALFGDGVEMRLVQAEALLGRQGTAATQQLKALEAIPEGFSDIDRERLWMGLAERYQRAGKPDEAQRLWATLAREQPRNVRVRLHLLDLALQERNDAALTTLTEELRQAEGDEGVFWRYAEASRLVRQAEAGDRAGLPRAALLQKELASRRGDWGPAMLLQARLDELEGRTDAALAGYLRAIKSGDGRPDLLRRAIPLLFLRQRYAEANDLLRRLGRDEVQASGLSRIASVVSWQTRDRRQALTLAQRSAEEAPENWQSQLWLGQILWSSDEPEKAEVALRKAAELAPSSPAATLTWVRYLAAGGKMAEAEKEVRRLAKLPSSGQDAYPPLALAACHEAVGETEEAATLYEKLLAEKPRDPAVLRGAAQLALRRQRRQEAGALLRRLLDPDVAADGEQRAWAQRQQAVELASQGRYRPYREALALLETQGQGEENDDLIWARALVLASRPGRLREALNLAESVRARRALTPAELSTLAQLHLKAGNVSQATRLLTEAADREKDNPQHLLPLARLLTRAGDVDQARSVVERLERLQPEAFTTAEVRARLLRAGGKRDEAVAAIKAHARKDDASLVALGLALEEMGEGPAAEELYRRLVERSKPPTGRLSLAAYLGRQGKLAEALEEIDRAWADCPPEAVALLAVALVTDSPKATAADHKRVARAIATANSRQPQSLALGAALGAMHILQGDLTGAEAQFRQVLERDPRNVVALNNLAWVLARKDDGATEALERINEAIAQAGPAPELLDTRGAIHLARGKPREAIRDLQEAVNDTPLPTASFHLALALQQVGHEDEARQTLRKAIENGLRTESLPPAERDAFGKLKADLGL